MIPIRQDVTVIPADDPSEGFGKKIGWTVKEKIGVGVVNSKLIRSSVNIELVLGESGLKILAECFPDHAALHLAYSDHAALALGMTPQRGDELGVGVLAPKWLLGRVSKRCWVVTESAGDGTAAARLVPRGEDWLHGAATREAKDALDPRSGKVLPSERQHFSISGIPGKDWPEWQTFSDQVDSTIDMAGVMDG